jgi:hypothetical protein
MKVEEWNIKRELVSVARVQFPSIISPVRIISYPVI